MAFKLDLNKSEQTIKLNLEKAGVNTPPEMDVAVVMDVSGSFKDEHVEGLTQTILNRFIPWSMVFDPDKKIDLFTFSNDAEGVDYAGEVTLTNYMDYMKKHVIGKVKGWCGGTDYRFVLQRCRENFGWAKSVSVSEKSGGLFGGLFGKKKPAEISPSSVPAKPRKSLILFVTDGDNSRDDEAPTERLLQAMQENGEEVYIMFFGVSNQRPSFRFLKRIADLFANTGLHIQYNVAEFANMSDENLCEAIVTDELVAWIKK